jgi:hypothetical protein
MALIIEDGSGVSNANSYGDVAGARAYAAARNVALDSSDPVVEGQMILAMDYIGSFDYRGLPVSFTQPLDWPRKGLEYDPDTPVAITFIPPQLIDAQYQLVIEQANGINLQPTSTGNPGVAGAVIEEKVDVLTTRYSDRVGTTSQPIMPKVDALLRTLKLPTPYLRTVRV